MALITCQNISKSYGVRDLFEGVSFLMEKSSRKALIGDNGTGKSTIMKILAGELSPDSGRVQKETGVSVGYLPQDSGFDGDFELLGSVACASPELAESYARLRSCRERLEAEPDSNSAAAELGDASHEFEALGGFGRLEQARIVLLMLGFLPQETDMLPRHLSGGQKTRAHLARLLLGEHDLLLLDEPTNHLDIDACERFVEYLRGQYQGAALIISHDRYFLDQICDSVLALEGGCVSEYKGNYSAYSDKRRAELLVLEKEREQQKKTAQRLEEAIQTLFSHRNFSGRDSLVKKLQRIRPVKEISDPRRMSVRIAPDLLSGREVLRVRGLSKSYGGKTLLRDVDFALDRGDKVGVVGPNGSGKSTFIKILHGEVPADGGTLTFGANVRMAYFAQEFDHLDPGRTVLEELLLSTDISSSEARTLLGRFLFSGDDAFKTVEQLSGGEKCRLSLAVIMAEKPNLLLLDEPTNHLDTASCEILENAVREYEGTAVIVSHDRYFLERTAGVTAEIRDGRFTVYPGPYSYYREKAVRPEQPAPPVKPKAASGPDNRALRQQAKPLKAELKALEAEIESCEERMKEITLLMGDESVYRDGSARELSLEYSEQQKKLEELMKKWESLQEAIDSIEAKIV